jgi:hypothetical protein
MIDSDYKKRKIPQKLEVILKLMGYQFDPANKDKNYVASIDIIPPPKESFEKDRGAYQRKYVKLIFTDGGWKYPKGHPHDQTELIKLLRLHKENVHAGL